MWCPFALQRLTATGFPTNQNWHGSSIFLVLAHTSIGHPLSRPPLHAIRSTKGHHPLTCSGPSVPTERSYGPVPPVLSTTTRPDFITQRMFSLFETAMMSARGSPATATISA